MSKQASVGHKALVADFLKHYDENHVLKEGKSLTYAHMQGFGMLRPFAVRLPVTMIAEFETLAHYGPWQSKQEMLYQLIRASMDEIARQESFVGEQMRLAAERGLEEWKMANAVKSASGKTRQKAKK